MNGSEAAIQAGISVLGAVVGAVLGAALPSRGNSKTGKIQIDKRHMTQVTINASAPAPAPAPHDNDDWIGPALAFVVVPIIIVMAYLRYRSAINSVVVSLQLFALFATFTALVTARVRSVVFDRRTNIQVTFSVVMAILALLGVYWLSHPPFGANAAFQQVLADGRTDGFATLTEKYGFDWFFFLTYQLLGILASILTVSFITLHSLKLFLITGVIVRQRLNAAYNPGQIKSWLLRVFGGLASCFFVAVICTAFSLVLVSGAGYALVKKLPEPAPQAPTTTNTPLKPPQAPAPVTPSP